MALNLKTLSTLAGSVALSPRDCPLEPMAGNPAPRLIETHGGMINAIGLQNIGVQAFMKKSFPPFALTPALPALSTSSAMRCGTTLA